MPIEDNAIAGSRERLHELITAGYARGKALIADGKRVVVTVAEDEDSLTVLQRKFFHGPVLGQISEQVVVDGVRYAREVWKHHLKNLILERNPRFKELRVPGVAEPVMVRMYWSTEELGVKAYSDFIDEVIAYATTEWRVEFRFLAGERYAVHYPPRSSNTAKGRETAKC